MLKRWSQLIAVFLILDGLYHFSGLRWIGLNTQWPESAVTYFIFFTLLWGSASIILGIWLWLCSNNMTAHKTFFISFAWWAILHSFILYWHSFQGLDGFSDLPSLYLWNPLYSWQLRIEALGLNFFTLLAMKYKYTR